MHEVKVKSILSPQNGMNLYRGCTHGCIYCDSRSTCYQMRHPFEDIEVKSNAVELLEQALRRKRKKCMIATGAMTDPYIPLEKTLGHTRRCLELIDEYGFGVSLQTKSDLILRDLDLLKRIHRKTKCVVQMTLTTYDEELCRLLEPHVCTTGRRAEVLNILRDEGIPTVVWMSPLLPFINDTQENVRGILEYCIQAKVYGVLVFGMGMTLRDGDRQYYYRKLDEHFPGLKERYIAAYGNAYEILSPNHAELMQLFHAICREHHIVTGVERLFAYAREFEDKQAGEQLSLFDLQ
ncbi:MAG TPA: radical SAM protein [Lachnospiraceae bacterium]|nr:radical SAM protein [Lachnospiraceae bacterium]